MWTLKLLWDLRRQVLTQVGKVVFVFLCVFVFLHACMCVFASVCVFECVSVCVSACGCVRVCTWQGFIFRGRGV